MWRPAHLLYVAALFGIALASGCTKHNPLYCAANRECMSSEARICDTPTNQCRGCTDRNDCKALDPQGAAPACIDGVCVACGRHDDCQSATEPVCDPVENKCRNCLSGTECAARDPKTPVCLGFAVCAECGKDTDCKGADKPICDTNTHSCRACGANTECAAASAATPVCDAPTGACLGCATRADCAVAEKPICDQATATCRACQSPTDCAPVGQVCSSTGRCLECEINADCKVPAKPICNPATGTCRGCQADSECPSEPGVCMAHIDGHCAIVSETIYVSDDKTGICGDPATTLGTITNPACTLQAGVELVSGTRRLVLVRGAVPAGDVRVANGAATFVESIVGQKQAAVTALGPTLTLKDGALYLRDLKLASAYAYGLIATGGTLRLDHVLIDYNANGGIVLDGAAFDIRNTTVTNSGPGVYGAYAVGGILVRALPNAGPKQLLNVTVQGNKPADVDCTAAIMGSGILTTKSLPSDLAGNCDVAACDPPGPTCGAQ